jgi:hypothetical protein
MVSQRGGADPGCRKWRSLAFGSAPDASLAAGPLAARVRRRRAAVPRAPPGQHEGRGEERCREPERGIAVAEHLEHGRVLQGHERQVSSSRSWDTCRPHAQSTAAAIVATRPRASTHARHGSPRLRTRDRGAGGATGLAPVTGPPPLAAHVSGAVSPASAGRRVLVYARHFGSPCPCRHPLDDLVEDARRPRR